MEEPVNESLTMIDVAYEFSAPQFYNFIEGETNDDVLQAELWFERSRPYAPSPFMPRIKASRSIPDQILCNFGEDDQAHKVPESVQKTTMTRFAGEFVLKAQNQAIPSEMISSVQTGKAKTNIKPQVETKEHSSEVKKALDVGTCNNRKQSLIATGKASSSSLLAQGLDVCTPAATKQAENKKIQTAKKISSMLRNPPSMNWKNQLQKSQLKRTSKPACVKREINNVKNIDGTPSLAHENQAIKRQKLEGGKTRPILTVNKQPNLPHKTKNGIVTNSSNLCSSTAATKTSKQGRKIYVREPAAPFVSTAEMMNKFQSSTREATFGRNSSNSLNDAAGAMRKPTKLTLTRPKTPEFVTSQRVRPVKIKSSDELEEEMLAKMPKFKARQVNKKIFEAPSLPAMQRTIPQPPEFKEFHLETMSRANQHAETSTVASTESSVQHGQNHSWKPHHLTAPKSPLLQTTLRARPPRIKSSDEIEKETLETIPQFKARPLNKKIFESKGDMGIFSNMKKQVTIPHEFHFEVDKRIPPQSTVMDLFDKLSINSESHLEKPLPRNTTPNPFHLHTEERGAEKEKRLAEELMHKQLEEERARVPRAHPYPYTTDYPVLPPKPEPRPCTKPEPFQLESLLRHEEEMQREMEEKRRMEMEEAHMRIFKAQPVLKEDPIPLPEKERRPLTEVQEFELHVNNRATDRAEFDKKIKEKEMMYKRYRDESESAKMMEEEKALKQLRRTLVTHARPIPKFDHPFRPQKSDKEVTKAKSPNLQIKYRKEKRRIIYPGGGVRNSSSPATYMR